MRKPWRSPRHAHWYAATIGSGLLLTALSCGGSKTTELRRLVETRGAQPYSRDRVDPLREVAPAKLGLAGNPNEWEAQGEALTIERAALKVRIASASGDAKLRFPRPIDAESIDAIEVEMNGLPALEWATLGWRRSDDPDAPPCSIRVHWRSGRGAARNRYLFEVAATSCWRGTVLDLTLQPTTTRAAAVEVGAIRALARGGVPAGSRGSQSAAELVLFSTEQESRPALLLRPGAALRMGPVRTVRDAVLRLAYAREATSTRPVLVEARAIVGSREIALSTVEVPAAPGWTEHRAELSALIGAEWHLEVGLAEGEPEALEEATFLANPEIISPADGGGEMNIVLISIDTLRADRLSLHGNPRPTSPVLERFARSGAVIFEKTVAAAASTLPAHASLFTGLDVLRHAAYLDRPLSPAADCLAEHLQRAGFRTIGVTGGGYLHPNYGLAQGFDRYRSWPRGDATLSDELEGGVSAIRKILAEGPRRPFFLFFHTYEVHGPYRAREPYYGRWTGRESSARVQPFVRGASAADGYLVRNRWPRVSGEGEPRDLRPDEVDGIVDLYDSGVANADRAVGEILEALRQSGASANTLVVITSDHGESLGENGLFGHGYNYDSNILVPFLLFDPRNPQPGRRISRQVRQIDVAATILELAGVGAPAGIDGRSLVRLLREEEPGGADPPAWSYSPETNHGLGVRRNRLKFILRDAVFRPTESADWEAYDLELDPAEIRPLPAPELGELPRLVDVTTAKLAAGRSSHTLDLENSSPEDLSGVLVWEGLGSHNVKRADATPASFRLRGPGELEFRVPSGSASRLRLQFPEASIRYQLRLETGGSGASVTGSLAFESLCDGPRQIYPGESAIDPVARGAKITVSSDLACEAGTAPAPDAELVARLRALGYIQ